MKLQSVAFSCAAAAVVARAHFEINVSLQVPRAATLSNPCFVKSCTGMK